MIETSQALNIKEAPPDVMWTLYWSWMIQGIGGLLPWNVFLVSNRFFQLRLQENSNASNFIIHFTLIFMTIRMIFLIFGASFIRLANTPLAIISKSTITNGIVFFALAVFCALSPIASNAFYIILLLIVLLVALLSALIESGLLTMLAYFPPIYTQGYLIGNGLASLIAVLIHAFSASMQTLDEKKAPVYAALFFGLTMITIILSWLVLWQMSQNNRFKWFFQKGLVLSLASFTAEALQRSTGIPADGVFTRWQLFSKVWDVFLSLFISTTTSMIITPSILFMTESSMNDNKVFSLKWFWIRDDYFHITALLLGNVCTLLGKAGAGFSKFHRPKTIPLLMIALFRLLFIPLLLMGNIKLDRVQFFWNPIYKSDLVFITLIILKSMTGGLLVGLCVIEAPLRVPTSYRGRVMAIVVYALALGLFFGTVCGLLLRICLVSSGTTSFNDAVQLARHLSIMNLQVEE